MHDDDDDLDRSALLARRDLLLRRALLVGAGGIVAGSASCSPRACLSPPAEPMCGNDPEAGLPAGSTTWKRRDDYMGGVATDKGPLFGSDVPVDPTHAGTQGQFTFDTNASGINDLNAVGVAALEELVPTFVRAAVRIEVAIRGDAPGPGVDGNARALGIQAFLATKGVKAEAYGDGTCASGAFHMALRIFACVVQAPPAASSSG